MAFFPCPSAAPLAVARGTRVYSVNAGCDPAPDLDRRQGIKVRARVGDNAQHIDLTS
jgi:hypothetical protein